MENSFALGLQIPRFYISKNVGLLLEFFLGHRNPCFKVTRSLATLKKGKNELSDNKKGKKKPKSNASPKIFLENEAGKLTSMYMEEAEKLAKSKNLQLLNLSSIGKKNTYKLIGVSEMLNEGNKKKNNLVKQFILLTDSKEHDVNIKLSKISSLLNRGKKVSVFVKDVENNAKELESLVSAVENEFKNKFEMQKIVQKNKILINLAPNEITKNLEQKTEEKKEEQNQNQSNTQ